MLQEQKKVYGPTRKAIEEMIQICQEKGKLCDYLESRKKEVVNIMEELFSFETSMGRIMKSEREEARAEGRAEGRKEGAKTEKEKTALILLEKNIGIPIIMDDTELSEDRIKEIAVEHGLIQ